jgi:diguanylate cyclase (GGDEF)-like protein
MMMTHPWRFAAGPLIMLATVAAILVTDHYLAPVPNPGAITFVALVGAVYLGGTVSGLISAAISIGYAAYYFSTPGRFLHFQPDGLARMAVLLIGTPAITLMVGALRHHTERSLRDERNARLAVESADRELRRLHASLDEVEDGVVLLDQELRAQFINRAFRRMFRLPDEVADSKPAFVALMYHGRKTKAYAIPDSELDAYVAQRTAIVRVGDETPVDLRLADGRVLRFKCKPLPDGGRMLSYVYVTDLVRHADELQTLRAALDQVDYGVILLDCELRIEFMNRAACDLGGVSAPAPGEKPSYAELIERVADNDAYAVPPERLNALVAERVESARRGDPGPVELRMADGKIMHVRCIMLRDGARMLTYNDVTDLIHHTEQLEDLATTDELSGLFNRRHFMTLADKEWGRFKRYGRPLAMLMLDIDLFKSINDRFGHGAGDKVITAVAEACIEARRSSDIVARVGGEEFALLLPETTHEDAYLVAERLRERIAKRAIVVDGIALNVTISVGVADAAMSMKDLRELMKDADGALYTAKRDGRNRVAIAGASDEVVAPIGKRVA